MLRVLISISIGSGVEATVVVYTVSYMEEEAEADDWSFLMK